MNVRYEDVLHRLKEERAKHGWTQSDLCRKVGMSQGHYCRAELGKSRFTYHELQYLVKAGIDLHYVYTGERIRKPRYYSFFADCTGAQMQCLAEMALPLISFCARELPADKAKDMRERVKYVTCILSKDDLEDSDFLQLRRYKAYSQRYMAGLLGVDVKKYCALESGRKFGDSELFLQMYNCFHLSPLLLLKDESGLAREVCSLLDRLQEESERRVFEYLRVGCNKIMVEKSVE